MEVVKFNECNVTYAQDQPEYLPLPAFRSKEGEVVSCWSLSFFDRLKVLLTGKIWLSVLTFNRQLQPLLMGTTKPLKSKEG